MRTRRVRAARIQGDSGIREILATQPETLEGDARLRERATSMGLFKLAGELTPNQPPWLDRTFRAGCRTPDHADVDHPDANEATGRCHVRCASRSSTHPDTRWVKRRRRRVVVESIRGYARIREPFKHATQSRFWCPAAVTYLWVQIPQLLGAQFQRDRRRFTHLPGLERRRLRIGGFRNAGAEVIRLIGSELCDVPPEMCPLVVGSIRSGAVGVLAGLLDCQAVDRRQDLNGPPLIHISRACSLGGRREMRKQNSKLQKQQP
jgi:hypothetical protein